MFFCRGELALNRYVPDKVLSHMKSDNIIMGQELFLLSNCDWEKIILFFLSFKIKLDLVKTIVMKNAVIYPATLFLLLLLLPSCKKDYPGNNASAPAQSNHYINANIT